MKRRNFLSLVAALSGAGWHRDSGAMQLDAESAALAMHRIAEIEFRQIDTSWPRPVGRNSQKEAHGFKRQLTVCLLTTDQGKSGWGMIRGGKTAVNQIADRVKGRSVVELFSPRIGISSPYLQPLDFVLHDLAGMILEVPVWKMVAGDRRKDPFITRIYSGMIYFDDLDPSAAPAGIDKLIEECRADYDYGYRQFKIKIGRGHRWMKPPATGMKRDISVVRAIHESFPDCDLLVDANNGYSVEDCFNFLTGIEGVPLFWIEEPFHESIDAYRRLHAWKNNNGFQKTYLADGEARPDTAVLKQLQSERILDIRLEDIVGLGFTKWRQLLLELADQDVLASPHAWGCGLKTIYVAHLAGGIGSVPTIEGVTTSDKDIDFGDNLIRDGMQQVSSQPGFGLRLV